MCSVTHCGSTTGDQACRLQQDLEASPVLTEPTRMSSACLAFLLQIQQTSSPGPHFQGGRLDQEQAEGRGEEAGEGRR